MKNYIFSSERLGFRNWHQNDIEALIEINNDDEVMAYFPQKPSAVETINFVKRMQYTFFNKNFCYFAVDTLARGEFIGFIGLSEKHFASDFTPCIDIGWRLKRSVWNQGLATEGAKACLAYGFDRLSLKQISAIAPAQNLISQKVMSKIGMTKVKDFYHPELAHSPNLQKCVLFSITRSAYKVQTK